MDITMTPKRVILKVENRWYVFKAPLSFVSLSFLGAVVDTDKAICSGYTVGDVMVKLKIIDQER